MNINDLGKNYTVIGSEPVKQASATSAPAKQKVPLLTKQDGGFGTALRDVAVGAGKTVVESGRGLGGMVQSLGQRAIAAVDPTRTYQDVRSQTGIKSINNSTPEGMQVADQLKSKSRGEQVGKVLGTAADLASGFVAAKGPQAVQKGVQAYRAGKEVKATEKVLDNVTPDPSEITPTKYKKLLEQGKIEPKTASQPARYVLSESEKQVAIRNKHLIHKDPVRTSINIMDDVARKDEEVGQFLRKNNGIFNSGELRNHILESLKDVDDVSIDPKRIEGLKSTLADGFIRALKKNDMESLWRGRKAFDQSIEKVFNGSPTLQNRVKKEFRNSIQDYIMQRTPDDVYKGKMTEMRDLYNLFDTVANKATKQKGKSAIQEWMRKNPTKSKIVGGLIGSGVIGTAVMGLGD